MHLVTTSLPSTQNNMKWIKQYCLYNNFNYSDIIRRTSRYNIGYIVVSLEDEAEAERWKSLQRVTETSCSPCTTFGEIGNNTYRTTNWGDEELF